MTPEKKPDEGKKMWDFLEEYINNSRGLFGSPFVALPKLMKPLSIKWKTTQKEVKEWISKLPFNYTFNGRELQVNFASPMKGMPKSKVIQIGYAPCRTHKPNSQTFQQGRVIYYFVAVYVLDSENLDGIRVFRLSDLKEIA